MKDDAIRWKATVEETKELNRRIEQAFADNRPKVIGEYVENGVTVRVYETR